MFQAEDVVNIKKHFYGSQQGHRWQYNTAHALCVLDY